MSTEVSLHRKVAFLRDPASYRPSLKGVQSIETHMAWIARPCVSRLCTDPSEHASEPSSPPGISTMRMPTPRNGAACELVS